MILAEEHLCKALEWVFYVLCLQSADLKELETDAFSKGHAVLRTHCYSVFKINFVCNNYSCQLSTLVLLFDSFKPLSQEMESIWVSYIIHQHYKICLSKKFKGDFLEDVLAGNINEMKFDLLIGFALNVHLLDVIFAALSHHIVMIEGSFHDLIYETSFTNSWLSGNDNSCS